MKRPPAVRAANPPAVRKHILLVVIQSPRNNLRANVLRKHGMEVVCANHIADARMLWHPNTYDLVLIDMRHENGAAVELCHDIKAESPKQLVAFLVGKPEYLAAVPCGEGLEPEDVPQRYQETLRQLMATACEALPRRGGFLEASWRMSLARSLKPEPIQESPRPTVHPLTSLPQSAVSFSFGEAVKQAEASRDEAS